MKIIKNYLHDKNNILLWAHSLVFEVETSILKQTAGMKG